MQLQRRIPYQVRQGVPQELKKLQEQDYKSSSQSQI